MYSVASPSSMPRYRMAIRYGDVRQQYHMADLEAASLQDALRQAMGAIPPDVDRTADLVEIRRAVDPDSRPEHAPE